MVPDSSSNDLHPRTGARFVLTRLEDGALPSYRVEVFLPGARRLQTTLRLVEGGVAVLDPELDDAWASAEALKLARVLRRNPKARLTRWRGPAA